MNLALTTLLAVLGYLLTVGVISPLLKYENKKTEIGIKLNYFSHIITSPGSAMKLADEAQKVIRTLAMELEAYYLGIQFKSLFIYLRAIPTRNNIAEVRRSLVFLSNSVHQGDNENNCIELGKVFAKLGINEVDIDNSIVKSMKIYSKQGNL